MNADERRIAEYEEYNERFCSDRIEALLAGARCPWRCCSKWVGDGFHVVVNGIVPERIGLYAVEVLIGIIMGYPYVEVVRNYRHSAIIMRGIHPGAEY
jgi:hypothetical protein